MSKRLIRVVVPAAPILTPDIWAAESGIRRDLTPGATLEKEATQTAMKWLRNGSLLPADKETADLAGVPFVAPKAAAKKGEV